MAKKIGRRWQFSAVAVVRPTAVLHSTTLFISMTLIIPTENLGTLLWRLLHQGSAPPPPLISLFDVEVYKIKPSYKTSKVKVIGFKGKKLYN